MKLVMKDFFVNTGNVLRSLPQMVSECRIYGPNTIMRKCAKVGKDLSQLAKQNGGKLTIEELNLAYKKVLPKGSKIEAVNDPQKAVEFLRNLHLSDELILSILESAGALFMKNFKSENLFFIPIENFSGNKAVNVATHEFEHALSGNFTFQAKKEDLLNKILGAERAERFMLKNADKVSIQNMNIQDDLFSQQLKISDTGKGVSKQKADTQGLVQHLGLSSKHRLYVQLRKSVRKVLDPASEKSNIENLKTLNEVFADEARAYRVGGKSAKKYRRLKNGSTMSEMTSQLFEETIGIIKKEIKSQRQKRLKRALGLKVRDYEGERLTTTLEA